MALGPPPVDVVANAARLHELDRLIVKAVVEWDTEALAAILTEFRELKTATRLALIDTPVNLLPDIADEQVRSLLQRISAGQPLPVEQALTGTQVGALLNSSLSEQEIEELGSTLLYSWMSHYEFVEALYEIGSIILATGNVPETLIGFVDEARHCYAFQQYSAVCSLTRSILEVGMRDLAVKTGALRPNPGNVIPFGNLHNLIEQFCNHCANGAHLRERLHAIRRGGNAAIHEGTSTDKATARQSLQETLSVLHEAYESASRHLNDHAA
jgi:hypothetical protein